MLDNDNIISTSVSEAVEKIPTDEKDYCKCSFMCFTLHSHNIQRADQHNSRNSCLPTRIHPVQVKKNQRRHFTENLHRKRCNSWRMISFIHCGSEKRVYKYRFPGNQLNQLVLEKEVASYIWVHSNSLIKNLIPFEDDAEICLLNFLMWSICKQPEDTFINKMASPKIDFYFEVFKQLKTMC